MCADKLSSEQARAGVTDESLGVAAVSLQHFEAAVPRNVRDFDQVCAALDCRCYEARP